MRLAEQGLERARERKSALHNWIQTLAESYVMVGEYDAALEQLAWLLRHPSYVSVPLLRVDPLWAPLRSHPRFQALLATYENK